MALALLRSAVINYGIQEGQQRVGRDRCTANMDSILEQEKSMKVTSKIRGGLTIASVPRTGGCRGGSPVVVA